MEGAAFEREQACAIRRARLSEYSERREVNASFFDHTLSLDYSFNNFVSFLLCATTRDVKRLKALSQLVDASHRFHFNARRETRMDRRRNQCIDLQPTRMVADDSRWVAPASFWHSRIDGSLLLALTLLFHGAQVLFIMIDCFGAHIRITDQSEEANRCLQVHCYLVDQL